MGTAVAMLVLALIIRLDRWVVWGGRWASLRILILILGSGYDSDPAGGLVAGGSMGPWFAPSVIAGVASCWSGGWGRVLRRVQAVVIAVVQGQVREIFSRWRRARQTVGATLRPPVRVATRYV